MIDSLLDVGAALKDAEPDTLDLGSHHFPVEAPEGTAKLLAGVGAE